MGTTLNKPFVEFVGHTDYKLLIDEFESIVNKKGYTINSGNGHKFVTLANIIAVYKRKKNIDHCVVKCYVRKHFTYWRAFFWIKNKCIYDDIINYAYII